MVVFTPCKISSYLPCVKYGWEAIAAACAATLSFLPLPVLRTLLWLAAPPPHHAQKQNPRVLGTPAPPPHHAQNQNPRVLGTPAPPPHHAQNQNPRVLGTPVSVVAAGREHWPQAQKGLHYGKTRRNQPHAAAADGNPA